MRKDFKYIEDGSVFKDGAHVGPLKAFKSIMIEKVPEKKVSMRFRGDSMDKTPEAVPKKAEDYNPQEHLTYTKKMDDDRFELSIQDAQS